MRPSLLIGIAALIPLYGAGNASCRCCSVDSAAVEHGYLIQNGEGHSYVWSQWGAGSKVYLPEQLWNLPLSFDGHFNGECDLVWAAFVDAERRPFVASTNHFCPLVIGMPPSVSYCEGLLPLDTTGLIRVERPPVVFCGAWDGGERCRVAVPIVGLRVLLYTLERTSDVPPLALLSVDTLRLTRRLPAQEIGALDAVRERPGRDTALWVMGSGGLLRRFAMADDSVGPEVIYDVGADNTVLCYGDGRAGTSSGRLYRFDGNGFTCEATPSPKAIRDISSGVACGDSGLILERYDGAWVTHDAGDMVNYVRCNPILTPTGRVMELIDSRWRTVDFSYRDDSTRIELLAHDFDTFSESPGRRLLMTDDSGSVHLHLVDPDRNASKPTMLLMRHDTVIDLTQFSVEGIVHTANGLHGPHVPHPFRPYSGPQGPFLADTTVELDASRTSIRIGFGWEYGEPVFAYGYMQTQWLSGVRDTTYAWQERDSVMVAAGGDTVTVIHAAALAAKTPPKLPSADEWVRHVSWYDLTGRRVRAHGRWSESRHAIGIRVLVPQRLSGAPQTRMVLDKRGTVASRGQSRTRAKVDYD